MTKLMKRKASAESVNTPCALVEGPRWGDALFHGHWLLSAGGAPWNTVPVNHETSGPGEHIGGHLIGRGRCCSNTTDRPEDDSASIHPALRTVLRALPAPGRTLPTT